MNGKDASKFAKWLLKKILKYNEKHNMNFSTLEVADVLDMIARAMRAIRLVDELGLTEEQADALLAIKIGGIHDVD